MFLVLIRVSGGLKPWLSKTLCPSGPHLAMAVLWSQLLKWDPISCINLGVLELSVTP